MSDPDRLNVLPETSDAARRLLDAYPKSDGMPAAAKASLEGQVADISAMPATSGVSSTTVGLIGTVVLAGAIAFALWPEPSAEVVEPPPPKTPLITQPAPPSMHASKQEPEGDAAPIAPVPKPRPTKATTKPKPLVAKKKRVYSLAAEQALLDRARKQIEADPHATLELTGEHEREFETAQLVDLREYIALQALDRLGASAIVRRRATAFLGAHPTSAFKKKVRALLERHSDGASGDSTF